MPSALYEKDQEGYQTPQSNGYKTIDDGSAREKRSIPMRVITSFGDMATTTAMQPAYVDHNNG